MQMKFHAIVAIAMGLAPSIVAQQTPSDPIPAIARVFDQIEKDHPLWPHYSASWENLEGGQAGELHLWVSPSEVSLMKVKSAVFDDHGLFETEYFLDGDRLLFVLERSEMTAMTPKAPTKVEERRFYFDNGALIRLQEKKGDFAAGRKIDTSGIKNTALPAAEVEGGPAGSYAQHLAAAIRTVATLRKVDPESVDENAPGNPEAPPSPAPSELQSVESDRWRVIEGTGSPDVRHALAWGFEEAVDWEPFRQEDGSYASDYDNEKIVNYVVNVRTGAIVGRTAGNYFGDKPSYNHLTIESIWHRNPGYVAQMQHGKWETQFASIHRLDGETNAETLSHGADLLAPATEAAFAHLKMSGHPALKAFTADQFTITLLETSFYFVNDRFEVSTVVLGQVPKSEEEQSTFQVRVFLPVLLAAPGEAPAFGEATQSETVPD